MSGFAWICQAYEENGPPGAADVERRSDSEAPPPAEAAAAAW